PISTLFPYTTLFRSIVSSRPQDQTNGAGADIIFTASVVGTPPITYLWQFNTNDIPSATNPALAVTNIQTSNVGTYTLIASNKFRSEEHTSELQSPDQ